MWVYQLLTILLIFSLPFFPKQYVEASLQSLIAIFIVLFSICLLPIFFRALLDDIKRKFIPTFCFLVFLIPLTIATIFSIDREQSIFQLRLFLSYFVIFVSSRVIFPNLRSKDLLAGLYLLLVSCLSFISLYNTLVRHLVNREETSFLWIYYGHNHLSSLLIFAIPLCLYFLFIHWKDSKVLPLILATFSLFVISLLFTFSIGAMISLALSLSFAVLFFWKTLPLKKVYFIVFFIVAFLGISSLYLFSTNKGIKTINLRKNPYTNVSHRFIYWQRAFDNFVNRPLTGSGLDTFHIANSQTPPFSRYTHNFFIQMLTDSGIFGFLGSLALIGAVFWHGYNTIKTTLSKRKRLFYLSLFVGVLASTMFATIDIDWHLPTVFLFFWIFASLSTN